MLKEIAIVGFFVIIIIGIVFSLFQIYTIMTDNYYDNDIKYKRGMFIDIIEDDFNFIFNDDTYLDLHSLGNYNISYVRSFINNNVEIKYTSDYFPRLVSIKPYNHR